MPNQPQRRPERDRSRAQRGSLGRIWLIALLLFVVSFLSGCMEALQTGVVPATAPPAPLITATVPPFPTELPAATGPAPTMPGSHAPDPATALPALTPTSLPPPMVPTLPSTSLPPLTLPTPEPLTSEARWRAQQIDRNPFEAPRAFATTGSELWWYDPLHQQHVILGRINGTFLGQATFTLRGQGMDALEVPYQVGVGYGLTALSPALTERIRAAGFGDWIETYVFQSGAITPR